MVTLSTPNRMVWKYFECLRRCVGRVRETSNQEEIHQEAALCVFMSVTVVEIFLNTLFRIVVEEEGYTQHREGILKDLCRARPLVISDV